MSAGTGWAGSRSPTQLVQHLVDIVRNGAYFNGDKADRLPDAIKRVFLRPSAISRVISIASGPQGSSKADKIFENRFARYIYPLV